MIDELELRLSASVDRPLAWQRGDSVRFAGTLLEVRAGRMARERPPHHLALALDLSHHIGAAGLKAVRSLVWRLADKLGERDTLSITTFGATPKVLVQRTALDRAGKHGVREALGRLEHAEGCNLFEGWVTAAEDCAKAMDDDEAHYRVILLASGQCDSGARSATELAMHARNLERRNLPTTAIGLGTIDPARLVALDDAAIRFTEISTEDGHIADALIFSCLELSAPVGFELEIKCEADGAERIEPLEPLSASNLQREPKTARELRSGMRRLEIFRLKLPVGNPGTTIDIKTAISFLTPDQPSERMEQVAYTRLTFATGVDNNAQRRDIALSHQVALRWQAALLREIVDLQTYGAFQEAERLLSHELTFIERYCAGLPFERAILDMLNRGMRTLYHRG